MLCGTNSEVIGEAVVIGILGPEEVKHDVENMMTRFLNVVAIYFNSCILLTSSQLLSLLDVASTFVYQLGYKFIVWYSWWCGSR